MMEMMWSDYNNAASGDDDDDDDDDTHLLHPLLEVFPPSILLDLRQRLHQIPDHRNNDKLVQDREESPSSSSSSSSSKPA